MADGALIRAARMHSLLLAANERRTPLEVATWFGAMQAQDAASGHWSLGVRCEGLQEAEILAAFERGDIVRTWPMRGTIHIVPGTDVRWLLELTGVRALAGAAKRREHLGLTEADATGAARALEAAMLPNRCVTRAEALDIINDAGIDTSGQRGYHLLWFAAQTGVTCIGPQRGTDQTFVLLDSWLPPQTQFTRTEALAELLFRYVRSHGPVPLSDFTGWTGLTMSDAKAAVGANDGRIEPMGEGTSTMWVTRDLAQALRNGGVTDTGVHALPGYDEFMLGYKDRSVQLPPGAMERIVPGSNGVFRATVVDDGTAVATWSRTLTTTAARIDVEPITAMNSKQRSAAERKFDAYARFLGRSAQVTWRD